MIIRFANNTALEATTSITTLELGLPGRSVRAEVPRNFNLEMSDVAMIDDRRYRLTEVIENNNSHVNLSFIRYSDLGAERDNLLNNLTDYAKAIFTTNNTFLYSPFNNKPSTGHQFQDYLEFLYWIKSTGNSPARWTLEQNDIVRGELLADLIREQYRENADLPQLVRVLLNFGISLDFNGTTPQALSVNLPEDSGIILDEIVDRKITTAFNNNSPTKAQHRELSIKFRDIGGTAIFTLVRPRGIPGLGADQRLPTTILPTLHADKVQNGGIYEALLEEAVQREKLINYGKSISLVVPGDRSDLKLGSTVLIKGVDGNWRVERLVINRSQSKFTTTILAYAQAPRPEFTIPFGQHPDLER